MIHSDFSGAYKLFPSSHNVEQFTCCRWSPHHSSNSPICLSPLCVTESLPLPPLRIIWFTLYSSIVICMYGWVREEWELYHFRCCTAGIVRSTRFTYCVPWLVIPRTPACSWKVPFNGAQSLSQRRTVLGFRYAQQTAGCNRREA